MQVWATLQGKYNLFADRVVTPNCDKNFFHNQQYVATVRYNFWENILKIAVTPLDVDLLYDCWYGSLINFFKLCKYVALNAFTSYFKKGVGDNGKKLLMLFKGRIPYGFFAQSYCKHLFSVTDLSLELTDFFLEVLLKYFFH